jgi:hypothetical protein
MADELKPASEYGLFEGYKQRRDVAAYTAETDRKKLQQEALAKQETAKTAQMQNLVSQEQLANILGEQKQYMEQETARGRTLNELQLSFNYGSFEGFNNLIKNDPIVSKAWVGRADKIEAFNPYMQEHIDAYRRAGMPEEVLDVMVNSFKAFDNGAPHVVVGEDRESGTKYTPEDIKAIRMAYPIVYNQGKYMATTTQDFIAEAGLLKTVYSPQERENITKILDKGKVALAGMTQDMYKATIAKTQAEADKATGEGIKATGEGAEAQGKAETSKLSNELMQQILAGDGTAEEKLKRLQDLTNPKLAMERKTAEAQLKKAEVDLKTAEQNLVKTGKDIELKGLEIGEKKEERADRIITKVGKVEALDNSMASVDKLIDRASVLFPDGVIGTVGNMVAEQASGSRTSDFFKSVETIDSQLWMGAIQEMKGLGALSNTEGDRVAKAIANLKSNQSKSQIIDNLKIVKNYFNASKQRAERGIKVALDAGDAIGTSTTNTSNTKPGGKTVNLGGKDYVIGSIVTNAKGTFQITENGPIKVNK